MHLRRGRDYRADISCSKISAKNLYRITLILGVLQRKLKEERGIQISEELSMIPQAANRDLARILFGTENENRVSALRMIFF